MLSLIQVTPSTSATTSSRWATPAKLHATSRMAATVAPAAPLIAAAASRLLNVVVPAQPDLRPLTEHVALIDEPAAVQPGAPGQRLVETKEGE